MPNPYDLLIKKDPHVVEWDTISTNPHISYLSGAISDKNTVTLTSSGAISAGYPVILNDNGTVSMPSLTPTTASDAFLFNSGGPSTYSIRYISMMYDPINNKIIIAYQDGENGSKGTYIIGTLSENSISFGTPAVYNNAVTYTSTITYDPVNEKIILIYSGFGYERTIVGSISGDVFVYGSPTTFLDSNFGNIMSSVYDTVNEKVIISLRHADDGGFGKSFVGTVSGDSITFGSEVVFANGNTTDVTMVYDSVNEKIIISYRDVSNSNFGTAIVGTVSGDSITFGSEVVFNSASTANSTITYDPVNEKIIIVYQDGGNSNYPTAIVGTVTGDSITFGTPVIIENSSSNGFSSVYDPINKKIIIEYNATTVKIVTGTVSGDSITFSDPVTLGSYSSAGYDTLLQYNTSDGNIVMSLISSDMGYSFIITPSSSTISSNNFLGIAQSTVSDGQQVKIGILGYLDTNQTGLTINTDYYSDTEGNITTDGNVSIGKSSSTTDLIIKG